MYVCFVCACVCLLSPSSSSWLGLRGSWDADRRDEANRKLFFPGVFRLKEGVLTGICDRALPHFALPDLVFGLPHCPFWELTATVSPVSQNGP